MSRTRAFLLELVSAGVAVGGGITLINFGAPAFIVIPICMAIAWYQMGFFMHMWKEKTKG